MLKAALLAQADRARLGKWRLFCSLAQLARAGAAPHRCRCRPSRSYCFRRRLAPTAPGGPAACGPQAPAIVEAASQARRDHCFD